jgi:hypothetical protein
MGDELPVFTKWMEFLDWLLPTTEKFPKKVRFTLSQRIDNLALDVVEDLVEARYSRRKEEILARANLRLEKLRVLLRVSYRQKHLPSRQYEHAMKAIHAVGRMLGGWIRWQRERE